MTIQIVVAEQDGERLFQTSEILFDRLEAYYEFEGGKLAIKRDGEKIAESTSIEETRGRAANMCFMGLRGIFDENSFSAWAVSALSARDLNVGDQIELEIDPELEASFADFLRFHHRVEAVFLASFPPDGGSIELGELRKKVLAKLQEGAGEEAPGVLRFLPPQKD